jgi:hypothetical protein
MILAQLPAVHGRSAVNISSFANGGWGEHRGHDTDGIRLQIEAAWVPPRDELPAFPHN